MGWRLDGAPRVTRGSGWKPRADLLSSEVGVGIEHQAYRVLAGGRIAVTASKEADNRWPRRSRKVARYPVLDTIRCPLGWSE
jgi:hypothetical protein